MARPSTIALGLIAGLGCSSGAPPPRVTGGGDTGGMPTASELTVTVTAPNGDPISAATVWIDSSQQFAAIKLSSKAEFIDAEGNVCDEPPGGAVVAACTNAQGVAKIPCDGLSGTVVVNFAKGSFSGVVDADCSNPGEVAAEVTTDFTDIAVVTGTFDAIEDVLAKLGFGSVNGAGHLELGSETFTLYDGDNSLDSTYDDFHDVLLNPAQLDQHDIIFINCDEFGLGNELSIDATTKLSNLRGYVENGGKLYVTDLSYDYVEQAFPEFVDFFGGLDSGSIPETPGAAEFGLTPSDSNAVVNDSALAAWLDEVAVNTGNPDSNCFNTTADGKTGARNEDGSIYVADLLGGWVLVDSEEADAPSDITEWIIGTDLEGAVQRPLTVTFDLNFGRVLFTSYHTALSCPSNGFWPQERVLQFLVFEL